MARSTAAFDRVIRLAIAGVKPPEIQKLHARIAREALSSHLARLDHQPRVIRFVDGREGAPEESVRPYGVIRYEFQRLAEIAQFALNRARELSPVQSGRYRDAWFVMAGGRQVAPGTIPEGVELILTNDQPYHRKLEMTANQRVAAGSRSVRLPPGIVERVRQEIFREFGRVVDAEVTFITLRGGYVVKTGRFAGRSMTYPALVLRPA